MAGTDRIDPQLRMLLQGQQDQLHPVVARSLHAGAAGVPAVRVTVEFRGALSDLEAQGFVKTALFEHPGKGYKIATGIVPLDQLKAMAAVEHVVLISAPEPLQPLLNYSTAEIGVPVLQHRAPKGITGLGVVVGIIDGGFDPRHGSFHDDDKQAPKSRVIAFWDQSPKATGGVNGPGVATDNNGRVYDHDTINAALAAKQVIGVPGNAAHGTWVGGVAFGDGSPGTCCVGGNTYVGVAPGAEIIAVGLHSGGAALGDSQQAINALDFIVHHPIALTKPTVVNISLGVMRGAHDGSSPFEKAIDASVAARTNLVVVVAAGNFVKDGWHAKGEVDVAGAQPGSFDLKFKMADKDTLTRYLEVWYPAGHALQVKLLRPDGQVLKPGNGTHADGVLPADERDPHDATAFITYQMPAQAGGAGVSVHSVTTAPQNNDGWIQVTFGGGARMKGEWTLQLLNPGNTKVPFDAWLERERKDNDDPPRFVTPTQEGTLGVPGTAQQAITVAAFENKKSCCDCFPSGDIADFSSRGPVRSGAAANVKPDLAAPGVQITTAHADAANLRGKCCDCCPDWLCCLYDAVDGTSFAAPHVAGVVALIFEANPTLTRDEIANLLRNTASAVPAPADKNIWGAGKLNAQAAVEHALTLPGANPALSAHALAAAKALGAKATRPHRPHAQPSPAAEPLLRLLAARLRTLPGGEVQAALISRHFSEARRLLNHHPRIATMWHRGEGPAMLRRLLDGLLDPEAEAPLRDASQRDYLLRFFEQLTRHGSAPLQATLAAHGAELLQRLDRPIAAQLVAPREGAA